MKGFLIFIGTIFLLCGGLGSAEAVGFTVTGLPNLSKYYNTYVPGNIVAEAVFTQPTITAGPATGTISSCYGSASTSPNIEQFTVLGTDLTSDITATAPTGFEVSLLPGNGYGNSLTLSQLGGTVNSVTVYVRSASSAVAGSLSGNVMLTSTGAAVQNIAVSATVNEIATVNPLSNQIVNNGGPTTAVNFTGSGNTFTWTNDTPGIGLAASGIGDIASFTAVNTSNVPVVATITATPFPVSFAYIPNFNDNTVSVINTTTNAVVTSIAIPNVPLGQSSLPPAPFGVSASTDGSRVYVSNSFGSVSVINTATNTVAANIIIPDSTLNGELLFPSPEGITVSRDGARVYVVNYNQQSLSIINTLTNTVVATLSLEPNSFALGGVTVSADGKTVYVANSDYSTVSVISMVTYKIVATIAVGERPVGIALSPDGSKLYVASEKQLWVINTANNAVITNIPTGVDIGNRGIAVSPDGSRVYVANIGNNSVAVISTATNTVLTTIPVGNTPYGISTTPDGGKVFVANDGSNTVSVVSTATNTVTGTVSVGNMPFSLGNFISAATQCTSPVKFTITVNPSLPTITATGTPSALTTTYGTPSVSTNFSVSGTNLTAGILVTPPTGFEASTDNVNFSPTVKVGGASTVASTKVYFRLLSTDAVDGYSGNIVLSSSGAVSINVPVVNSVVTPAALTITANNVNKTFGTTLTGSSGSNAFTVSGLQNSETIGSVTIAYGTGSLAADAPQTYMGSVMASAATGGTFNPLNYTIIYVPGNIVVNGIGASPTITVTQATGTISACYGAASASPNIQQFTLSANNLTGDITGNAPTGFEVSLSKGSGYGSSITITQTGGLVNSTLIYVRSSVLAAAGGLSGNVVLSSEGATSQKLAVNGTVNALPTANVVNNQTISNGDATVAVGFTGLANAFIWTNDTPNIGLPASGAGDIAPFKAVNIGSNPVTATITATPISTGLVYIANSISGDVSVISTLTNTVIKTIAVGNSPWNVLVSPDRSKVYVSNLGTNDVSVISTSTNTVIATVSLSQKGAFGMAFNSNASRLYVANQYSNTVSVVNTATNTEISTFNTGSAPSGLSISPDGGRLYVVNNGANSVSVIDTTTGIIMATIVVGNNPLLMVLSPDGKFLYVANEGPADLISVINTTTNMVESTISLDNDPEGIAISSDGTRLYATSWNNKVWVINTTTNALISTIPVGAGGSGPQGISVTHDGSRLYVSTRSNYVAAINTETNTIVANIPVGNYPESFGSFIAEGADCTGVPITFTITVNPSPRTITVTGTPSALTTTSGTASPSSSFAVSGTNLTAGILVTPPTGFEVSTDNINFSSTVMVGTAGTVASTTIYIRLPSTDAPGGYSGNVILSSAGATPVNLAATASTVTGVNGPPTITTTQATGTITACAGSASTDPNIQQFTVSGTNLTADIIAAAPNNFEISESPGSGYGNSLTLTQTGGAFGNTTIYVRSSSLAPAGSISGNVSLATAGLADQKVPVAGSINALPTVNAVPNQTVVSGTPTKAVAFTGTGSSFTWTNDTPSIGLAASGSGYIPTFTAVNNTTNPVTATVTVTPWASASAYITNQSSGTVSVIDLATNAVVKSIPVGINPFGISVSPDGSKAYVANTSSNSVSVIDTKTNAVTATIPVGESPGGLTVSADGSTVYVVCLSTSTNATIWVINTSTNSTTQLSASKVPSFVAANRNNSHIYVTSPSSNSVFVIDTQANTIVANVTVGNNPQFIAISPDGKLVYVANFDSGGISVISTATNTVTATIATDANPFGITFSADGSRAYVANYISNSVSVINTATNAVTSTITGFSHPEGLSLSADGSRLYVANQGTDNVAVIDLSTNTILTTVAVQSHPGAAGNFIGGGAGCAGTPVLFTITVTPPQVPTIVATANASSVITTVYGTPSPSNSFTVSGSNTVESILVTPSANFEVSTDNINFSNTLIVGSAGTIATTTVYVRLTQTAAVGNYQGNLTFSTSGANNVGLALTLFVVTPAPLIITANNVHNTYGNKQTGGGSGSTAFTTTGLQNSETVGSITTGYGKGTASTDPAGTYTGSVTASAATGGTFNPTNYTITYIPGDIIVAPTTLTIIADDKIKIYGEPNPVLTVGYIGFVNTDGPNQLTTAPVITTTAVTASPVGQYPITVNGAASPNYTISYLPGVLTVELTPVAIIIPNTFTPNGDGINDTWDIKNIEFFPKCTVDIFTRWGQKVYSSIGYGIAWDGIYNNTRLPTGTYYYVIDLKNGSKLSSGFVAIVR